jgi:cytoskeleton protein RodZ
MSNLAEGRFMVSARGDGNWGEGTDGLPAPRLGADLRAARERLGWTLPAIAAHLRIRLPFLEAIEQGRTDDLPGNAYAVGFIRTYAQALGLDVDEVARRFRAEAGEVSRKTELDFPAPVPERGVPALAVVLVGALLVVGAYAGWYRLSGNRHPAAEAVQQVPTRLAPLVADKPSAAPVTAQIATPAPVPPADTQVATAIPPAAPMPVEAPPPSVSPSSAAAATAEPPSPLPSADPPVAAAGTVLRATADAWIQVRDGSGHVLLNRVLRAGETWPVPAGHGGLLLTTGNAGGTELVVDGVASAPLGGDGAVRRDLPLQAEGAGKLAAVSPPPAHRIILPHNQ